MNFISLDYFYLFTFTLLTYFLIPKRVKWVLLLVVSCFFYASFIPYYLLILFVLILIDYFTAFQIYKSSHKKQWLILSLTSNLTLLGFFKYYNFFTTELNSLTGADFPLHHLLLPIGLSFHTFQSMSYTIEVYRGNIKPERHLGYYALYVLFFPQLVAGPIERPQHMFPQFRNPIGFSFRNLYVGIQLITLGIMKKVLIADRVSDYVDASFLHVNILNGSQAILAMIFFSFQIYTDFSGYSDIARGSAKCLGFNLSQNFNSPYLSTTISQFWNRWHITLYSWFRDYIYVPLGGNRHGKTQTIRNYFVTFGLSGLWHGAGLQFIFWGLIHAALVSLERLSTIRLRKLRFPKVLSMVLTFSLVTLVWTFFRAASISDAFKMFSRAATLSFQHITSWKLPIRTTTPYGNYSLVFTFAIMGCILLLDRKSILNEKSGKDPLNWFLLPLIILLIIFFGIFHTKSFIYFQF